MLYNVGDIGRIFLACLGAFIIYILSNGECGRVDVSLLIFVLYNNILILDSRRKK